MYENNHIDDSVSDQSSSPTIDLIRALIKIADLECDKLKLALHVSSLERIVVDLSARLQTISSNHK